jgi:hypothetical protein
MQPIKKAKPWLVNTIAHIDMNQQPRLIHRNDG